MTRRDATRRASTRCDAIRRDNKKTGSREGGRKQTWWTEPNVVAEAEWSSDSATRRRPQATEGAQWFAKVEQATDDDIGTYDDTDDEREATDDEATYDDTGTYDVTGDETLHDEAPPCHGANKNILHALLNL